MINDRAFERPQDPFKKTDTRTGKNWARRNGEKLLNQILFAFLVFLFSREIDDD